VRLKQGLVIGRLEAAGFSLRNLAVLESLTQEIEDSFKIEGESIDSAHVRSSIARKLGIVDAGIHREIHADHFVEGVVDMMLDATTKSNYSLTRKRLLSWHAALFPTGYSGLRKIDVGRWRRDEMRIVSGAITKERVHYVAPKPQQVSIEMNQYFAWVNSDQKSQAIDPILKAGAAHFRFIIIHPFDDGNGRLARAITEMLLTRADGGRARYYSLSSQLLKERAEYYGMLERVQYSDGDITEWLDWYLGCLDHAIEGSLKSIESTVHKADFWDRHKGISMNVRHQEMINRLLDGFTGKLTTTKWAKITKVSHDTALRDIKRLIEWGLLEAEVSGGRSTSYRLVER
jgi:Fic family protein